VTPAAAYQARAVVAEAVGECRHPPLLAGRRLRFAF